MTSTTQEDGKSQLDKFKSAARDLECDDDDALFKQRVSKIASHVKTVISSNIEEDKEFRKAMMKQEKGK